MMELSNPNRTNNRHSRFPVILLLLVQLCLPLTGKFYISTVVSMSEAGHTEAICLHTEADADNESRDGHEQILRCHELNAPSVTASGPVLDYSPAVSILTSSDKDALLLTLFVI